MRKKERLYLGLFALIIVLGVAGFVYSQAGNSLASTAQNPGHTSEQILCNGCVGTANIANGAIIDADVSNGAGIYTRKINGANGWRFVTGQMSSAGGNNWYETSATTTAVMGMTNWALGGPYIEITCVPSYYSGKITTFAGDQGNGIQRWNHNTLVLQSGASTEIYRAQNSAGTSYQTLEIKVTDTGLNAGTSLSFRRNYAGNLGNNEPLSTNFECHIKILSLCGGNAGQASC